MQYTHPDGLILRSTAEATVQVGVMLRVLLGHSDATVHPEAAECAPSTLNGTPTLNSHSGTA